MINLINFNRLYYFVKKKQKKQKYTLFIFTKSTLQILGENVKKRTKDGRLLYELGVIYYERCTRDKKKFKKMTSWWLVETSDVLCNIPQPAVEKVSGKRFLYSFGDFDPESVTNEKGE